MSLRLYNSLHKSLEEFHPLTPAHVTMYVCGPTVYDRIHLGNARPIVVFDMLYRLLRASYPHVTYVRNITDVDDKINQRARERGVAITDLTHETTQMFHQDISALNVLAPTVEPRATAHILMMQDMITALLERGHAYIAADHVLFDVETYAAYGQLSGTEQEHIRAGARVEVAGYKRNPHDFVLWKPSSASTPGWDSPWGYGRPGWHIECSAMSKHYLGAGFDIHGGGRDLMFPHHENEIAQSVGCDGPHACAQYWVHNEMLTVEGEKMSKSLGNFVTLHAALQDYAGEVVRFMLLSTHYRKPLDWTAAGLDHAKKTLDKFYTALQGYTPQDATSSPDPRIQAALSADLNTPLAFSYLHDLAGQIHKTDKANQKQALQGVLRASAQFMGLLMHTPEAWFQERTGAHTACAVQIETLIAQRAQAKSQRDFATADRIRQQLETQGIALMDSPDGTTWRHI